MGYHAYSLPSDLFNPTIRLQTSLLLEVIVGSCAEVAESVVSSEFGVVVTLGVLVDVSCVIDSSAAAFAALVVIVVVGEDEVEDGEDEGVVLEVPKTVLRIEALGEGEMGVDLVRLSW